ncbi:MAG: hypothetical protein H7227_02165 [Actinobacteria bacterium]|nr:hypothetical protein [Actinomycetota bacterium]
MQAERTSPSLTPLAEAASNNAVTSEAGFGILEVVVSMFLLSIMAMSYIPLLLNSVKDTATNTTIATATQIVNEQIEGARAVRSQQATTPSCADITQFLAVTPAPVVDPRGVTLVPTWSAPTCPATYPGVVRAAVSVTKLSATTPIASAVTFIFVKRAV